MTDELRFYRSSVANDDEIAVLLYIMSPKSNRFAGAQTRTKHPSLLGPGVLAFDAAALTTAAPSSDKAALEP